MRNDRVVIIGAGIGGLAAAMLLGARGFAVTVVEAAAKVGGKMRELDVGSHRVDGGPTVLTLPEVFARIFDEADDDIAQHVVLSRAERLARHAWSADERLDLYADPARSEDAVGTFAGALEADGFRRFSVAAKRVFETLEAAFLSDSKVGPVGLMRRVGLSRLSDLVALRPYESLWSVLGEYFRDARLRQLFGRYATYCGSSPFRAPATLMLIAHVEARGVWQIDGGLQRLAEALERVALRHGVAFRMSSECTGIDVSRRGVSGVRLRNGDRIEADWVIANVDPQALADGRFGVGVRHAILRARRPAPSLSALVWTMAARTRGFELGRHNVFLSRDYGLEFDAYARGRLPAAPSAYVCGLDRDGPDPPAAVERLQIIVNAPAERNGKCLTAEEIERCHTQLTEQLSRCGLHITPEATRLTTPSDFATLFPASGGALYGQASHGWMASFLRPGARTRIPRLYLAGGATHPGAGVPMAALSGHIAADQLTRDRVSTGRYHRVAMPGGTSTG